MGNNPQVSNEASTSQKIVKFQYSPSEYYEGQALNNLRHGKGVLYNKREKYEGEWEKDEKCGNGKYFYSDGELYDGEWKNNKKHGFGSYFYNNGEIYMGNWVNDSKSGAGTWIYPDGSQFEGNFKNNKRHGKGIYTCCIKNQVKKYEEVYENGERKNRTLCSESDDESMKQEKQIEETTKVVNSGSKEEIFHNESSPEQQETGNQIMTTTEKNELHNDKPGEAQATEVENEAEQINIKTTESFGFAKAANLGADTISLFHHFENLDSFKNVFSEKDVKDWTEEDVCNWLKKIGLENYAPNFFENKINGKSLLKLKEQDIKELGVLILGDVINLEEGIKKLLKMNHLETKRKFNKFRKGIPQNKTPVNRNGLSIRSSFHGSVFDLFNSPIMEEEDNHSNSNSEEQREECEVSHDSLQIAKKNKKTKNGSSYQKSDSSRSPMPKKSSNKNQSNSSDDSSSNEKQSGAKKDHSGNQIDTSLIVCPRPSNYEMEQGMINSSKIFAFPEYLINKLNQTKQLEDNDIYCKDPDNRLNGVEPAKQLIKSVSNNVTDDCGKGHKMDLLARPEYSVCANKIRSKDSDSESSLSSNKESDSFQLKKKAADDHEKKKKSHRQNSVKLKMVLQKFQINFQMVEFGKQFGEGAYGKIYQGIYLGQKVALKEYGDKGSEKIFYGFLKEVSILASFRHPNILLYMGVITDHPNKKLFMVSEFMERGSLYDHLHGRFNTHFSQDKIFDMLEDIALGMTYIIDKNFFSLRFEKQKYFN